MSEGKGWVPRCQGVKRDGSPCTGWAIQGTNYCRHHQDQAPKVEILTPQAIVNQRLDALDSQFAHVLDLLEKIAGERRDSFDESQALAAEKEAQRQRDLNLTPEEVEKARLKALQQAEKMKTEELSRMAIQSREILGSKMMSYTPFVDDIIPYGHTGGQPINWVFRTGVIGKFPKTVIDMHERKQEDLRKREQFRRSIGSPTQDGLVHEDGSVGVEYNTLEYMLRRA